MARNNGTNWVKWILILLFLGAAAWGGWWYWNKPRDKGPDYRTAAVTRGDVTQAVTASGQLNPVLNIQVGSQISGIIQKLYADFNSIVTQGQVVAEIDASTYRANTHQAEGDLEYAKSAAELAAIEAKRATELLKGKLVSQSDYDKAQAELHQADAQVKIREAALEKSRVDWNRCTIYAPTNGIVISRNVDVGQTVAASLSAPTLFVIANSLSQMQIDAMVSEADIGGVELDQTANFTVDAFPGRTFRGKIIQMRNSPATNQNVVTYDTVVAVENRDLKLKPGMTANVSIVTAEHEGVLKIPNAALRFRPADAVDAKPGGSVARGPGGENAGRMQGGPGSGRPPGSGDGGDGAGRRSKPDRVPTRTVYILASTNAAPGTAAAKPQPRPIKTGISDGVFTEVTEGLEQGEIVVVGMNSAEPAKGSTSGAQPNPFGGGGGRRF